MKMTDDQRRLLRRALVLLEIELRTRQFGFLHFAACAESQESELAYRAEETKIWNDQKTLVELVRLLDA